MILSMTGIGRSRHQDEQIQATVEIRAVNNKYLKLNLRLPDALSGREPQIDRIVRQYLERGTLTVNCQLTWVQKISPFAIDERVLEQYLRQAQATAERLHLRPPEDLRDFLHLPGVVADQSASLDDEGEAEWLIFEPALRNALESLQTFRRTEGDSMEAVLTEHCREISEAVDAIQARSPVVVDNYRQKLKDRVNDWLTQQGVRSKTTTSSGKSASSPTDLISTKKSPACTVTSTSSGHSCPTKGLRVVNSTFFVRRCSGKRTRSVRKPTTSKSPIGSSR